MGAQAENFEIINVRRWASAFRHLSPVPEHSGTGLGPPNPLPDSFRHRHFFIPVPVPEGLDVGQSDIPA